MSFLVANIAPVAGLTSELLFLEEFPFFLFESPGIIFLIKVFLLVLLRLLCVIRLLVCTLDAKIWPVTNISKLFVYLFYGA